MISSLKKLLLALIIVSSLPVQASPDVSSGPNFLGKFVIQNYGKFFGASMALFAASAAIGRFERPFVTEMNNLQRLKKNIETHSSLGIEKTKKYLGNEFDSSDHSKNIRTITKRQEELVLKQKPYRNISIAAAATGFVCFFASILGVFCPNS